MKWSGTSGKNSARIVNNEKYCSLENVTVNHGGMVWMAERIPVAWFEWLREFLWHGLNDWENSCGMVWMTEKITVAWFEWVRNTLWHGICHNEFPWHCLYDRKQQRLVLLRIFPWHEFFLALMMVLIRKKELFCIQIYKQIKIFLKIAMANHMEFK